MWSGVETVMPSSPFGLFVEQLPPIGVALGLRPLLGSRAVAAVAARLPLFDVAKGDDIRTDRGAIDIAPAFPSHADAGQIRTFAGCAGLEDGGSGKNCRCGSGGGTL